jgi:maltooligosyltrehalose trehalohydrolase
MMNLMKQRPGISFQNGQARAILWAPQAAEPALLLTDTQQQIPLTKEDYGYWTATTNALQPGGKYKWLINGKELPDPASLAQPEGVHGPSLAVDLALLPAIQRQQWQVHDLESFILYELHTGTFSHEGTFAGIEARLDHLVELGVNAIEIMPVAAFPGNRNWGYDGVFSYAVHSSYGGVEGLVRLVDKCHEKGLAVVLDVVYNHLGPEGNYLGEFGPYFTDKYSTPWGGAINFDDAGCDGVRSYFIQNALMWFRDFGIDALRMDAVHAIKDFSARHLLQELRQETDKLMRETGRRHYLIVECDLNDPRFINSEEKGGFGMDAQWMDEFHHALRVAAGEARSGYYTDFDGLQHLSKSYEDAYVYDGIYSPHRDKIFGRKASENGGQQFIVFSQNHDQVGNRMLGERTSTLLSFELQKLLAGAVLVSPFLPMLFMGEEWAEPAPFLYFVSHTDPELAKAVREGRRAEFAAFYADGEAPDPQSEETFNASRLQWQLLEQPLHATMLRYYKALIALRKKQPSLSKPDRACVRVQLDEPNHTLALTRTSTSQTLTCLMNFSSERRDFAFTGAAGEKIFDSAAPEWNGPQDAPTQISHGRKITLQPHSLLIYSSHV